MRVLPALTGLRGVAALMVVAFHLFLVYAHSPEAKGSVWEWTAAYGYLGVDLFFVLSGFLLARGLVATPNLQPTTWLSFLRRRWIRTAPPYYAAILAALVLAGATRYILERPTDILAHLVYVPNHDLDLVMSINVVFWSLAVEFQIYAIFPLLVWAIVKRPIWGLVGFATISVLWTAMLIQHGNGEHNLWVIMQAPTYLVHFALGIGLALLEARGGRLPGSPAVRTGAALAIILGTSYASIPPGGLWPALWDPIAYSIMRTGPAIGFALLLSAVIQGYGALRALELAPLRRLGDMSYSLYLIHLPVIYALVLHAPWVLEHGFAAAFGLVILPCLLAAWLLYRLVEVPALSWKSRAPIGIPNPTPKPVAVAD